MCRLMKHNDSYIYGKSMVNVSRNMRNGGVFYTVIISREDSCVYDRDLPDGV